MVICQSYDRPGDLCRVGVRATVIGFSPVAKSDVFAFARDSHAGTEQPGPVFVPGCCCCIADMRVNSVSSVGLSSNRFLFTTGSVYSSLWRFSISNKSPSFCVIFLAHNFKCLHKWDNHRVWDVTTGFTVYVNNLFSNERRMAAVSRLSI